jgi:hypothetical protein
VTNCGNNCGVNWSVTQGSGKVNSSGMYTAPNRQESDTVHAQAQADLTKTASASVTVPAVGISISPTSVSVTPNGTQQFNSTVIGTTNTSVSYSALTGTITPSGLYTAPGSAGNDTVTVTAAAAPNPQASASVTVQSQSQNACGNTLNWTSSTCQTPAVGQLNTALVNGVNDPNAWTIDSRHGEYGQAETECNGPWDVSVLNGYTRITAEATSRTCGDFSPSTGAQCSGAGSPCPGNFPYSTGDVQWNTLSFQYGSVVYRLRMPLQSTQLWPAIWLLGSNCQNANKYTGDTGIGGCPNIGQSGYREIDLTECFSGTWCQFNVFNPSQVGSCNIAYSVDGNFHTYGFHWTSSSLSLTQDGNQVVSCSGGVTSGPLFLIYQIQTGGAGGTPKNSLLPSYLDLDYVKVCNSSYSLAQCQAAATDGSDPNVIFYDNFGGPAQ